MQQTVKQDRKESKIRNCYAILKYICDYVVNKYTTA